MDSFLRDIVNSFSEPDVPDKKIVDLVTKLADSGERFKFDSQVFDFASTGGPSSLTTILVPLYLFAYGVNVINLAVPGRPAGAVDVLGQIPEYKLNYYTNQAICKTHFYLHLEADARFAPLDRQLYEYRKAVNKINNPNLAIASLLSKKIVSGASNIGLDIRVSSFGNFGATREESVCYAKKYNRIANQFGITSICFLSNAAVPYQQYIGRGEALIALYKILNASEDNYLGEHNKFCIEIAQKMVGEHCSLTANNAKDAFTQNLLFQGSKYEFFENAVEKVISQPYRKLFASRDGFVSYNLPEIRRYIVCRQKMDEHSSKYPDPSGIVLLQKQGDYIEKEQPVLLIRNSLPLLEKQFSFFEMSESASIYKRNLEVI